MGAALLAVALAWCAPALQGNWNGSGHTNVADAFDLQLTFESVERGLAVYATESGERAVPVCRIQLNEQRISFVIDTRGQTTCATLEAPLTFRGILGQDVIAGRIVDDVGEKVGQWRAFRAKER